MPFDAEPRVLTALSLFSGIGGLCYALERAAADFSIRVDVLEHVDISQVCKTVWAHNHPADADRYKVMEISSMRVFPDADVWLMSPPCQPFTKGGNEMHEADARAQPFIKVLDALRKKAANPQIVFVENVPEFGNSVSNQQFKQALGDEWLFLEHCISPEVVGVPYTRTRFYSMAIRRPPATKLPQLQRVALRPVADFINRTHDTDQRLRINENLLRRMRTFKFDVVTERSSVFGTITGGYGKRVGRQGPLVLLAPAAEETARFRHLAEGETVRRFSPREILHIHGFPLSFTFPPETKLSNQYHLIGNSISVDTAAAVMRRGLSLMFHQSIH